MSRTTHLRSMATALGPKYATMKLKTKTKTKKHIFDLHNYKLMVDVPTNKQTNLTTFWYFLVSL